MINNSSNNNKKNYGNYNILYIVFDKLSMQTSHVLLLLNDAN